MKSMQLHCLDLGSELIIAAGKRKFSYQSRHVPVKCLLDWQNGRHAQNRSKRCLTSSDSSGSEITQKRAKRQVKYSTFEKWRRELNREHRCLEWLKCDRDEHDRNLVSTLWCNVCRRYKEKLQGMRNYTGIWVSLY